MTPGEERERPFGDGVDAHHHLWDPDRHHYPWLTDERRAIRRPFRPADLRPHLDRHGIGRTVVVEARSSLEETEELLSLAHRTDFVAGVVGWVDLADPGLDAVLRRLRALPGGDRLVGVRHPVREEPDPAWLVRPEVLRGLAVLAEHGLAYDLLAGARELPWALVAARRVPGLTVVVEHMGCPDPGRHPDPVWEAAMARLAERPGVACKLSGLAVASGERLASLAERLRAWFGEERLLFGSDWPVCLLAASYEVVMERLDCLLRDWPEPVRRGVRGVNAARIYRLPPAPQAARKATPSP